MPEVPTGAHLGPFGPLRQPRLDPHPDPARDYAAAVARIEAIRTDEARLPLIPEAASIAHLKGHRTPEAVLIFHGFTTVPAQFEHLARAYADRGHNVWVPRLPFHGETNRLTRNPSRLTAELLRDFADRNVDIAAGLGEHVTVVGLSVGGSLCIWASVARSEVSHTALFSPLMLPTGVAPWQAGVLARLLRASPVDVYRWWDPVGKDTGPKLYAYPRLSLKGLAAMLSLTRWAARRARRRPIAGEVVLVRNDGDPFLDASYVESFVRRLVPDERLRVHTIPAGDRLGHDLVCAHPAAENYATIDQAYAHLGAALGLDLADPRGESSRPHSYAHPAGTDEAIQTATRHMPGDAHHAGTDG